MKILFIDSNHPVLHETLEAHGHQCDLHYHLSKEEIMECLADYDGVVIRSRIPLTSEVIDLGNKLRFIARAGAGMENIDVAYARSKGIECIHAPEGNMDAVAEHALGMLLALFNNICRADREVRSGKWIREGNRGIELMGRTVGIIGYGNMGSSFARRLAGFGVKVLIYDKYKSGFGTTELIECDEERIFNEADVLSIHVPLTAETKMMVDSSYLSKFRKDIFIINTARGKVLNTADLVEGLKSGKVRGACLDVLEYEMSSFEKLETNSLPAPFQYLRESDRVILTPHIAGWTHESNEKIAKVLAAKILALAD
jgi:D-3-phosphoglycerate dehydrogenase